MSEDVSDNRVIRDKAVGIARSFIHTPYHHQGMVKGAGVDCLTLLILVFREVGIVPMDFHPGNYSREWYFHRSEELYLEGVKRFARQLSSDEKALPGDLALYKIGKCVSHGAIILDDDYLIHADRKAGQVDIMERRNPELVAHFHSYWTPFK